MSSTAAPAVAKILSWVSRRPYWVLTAAVLITLGPFVWKPFNIDEPLFVWEAQQITRHPANPYGFNVNWSDSADREAPMWSITKNPPLTSYYLALAAAIVGWKEVGLHGAFLLPALAAVLGTFRLAQRMTAHPLLAALLTLFAPVFLVSSISVMSDTLMLAFWVWAVVLWFEGLESAERAKLALSAVMVALAALTKYFAISLVPLLLAYGLMRKRRLGLWVLWLLIPLAILGAWQGATYALYGQVALSGAAAYSAQVRAVFGLPILSAGLTGLAFLGGCLAPACLASLPLYRPQKLVGMIGATVALVFLAPEAFRVQNGLGAVPTLALAQVAFWAFIGLSALVLAFSEVSRRDKDPATWLLVLWVGGTFVFAAFLNWSINGRSILPLTPAMAILVARALERGGASQQSPQKNILRLLLTGGATVGLLVATADSLYARAVREVARQTANADVDKKGMRFLGHWGFQYYMEAAGATAFDGNHPEVHAGDCIAIPFQNPSTLKVQEGDVLQKQEIRVTGCSWLATMHWPVLAGFYSSLWGPLPFAVGEVRPEGAFIVEFIRDASLRPSPTNAAALK